MNHTDKSKIEDTVAHEDDSFNPALQLVSVFDESTHSYLFLSPSKSYKGIGCCVLTVQIICYIILLIGGILLSIEDAQLAVSIQKDTCYSYENNEVSYNEAAQDMVDTTCESSNNGLFRIFYFIIGMILLMVFLSHDMFGAFAILFSGLNNTCSNPNNIHSNSNSNSNANQLGSSEDNHTVDDVIETNDRHTIDRVTISTKMKMYALFILIESYLAIIVTVLNTAILVEARASDAEIIASAVGVIFIHDIDEIVKRSLVMINKNPNNKLIVACTFASFVIITAVTVTLRNL